MNKFELLYALVVGAQSDLFVDSLILQATGDLVLGLSIGAIWRC